MDLNYKPLAGRVLVERKMLSNKTPGGIVFGDPKPSLECEVLRVADDVFNVTPGNLVIVPHICGTEVTFTIDNQKVTLLSVLEKDILGIMG